jgi:protein-S-isoprenylcysteine O-methyltransferase Ste14
MNPPVQTPARPSSASLPARTEAPVAGAAARAGAGAGSRLAVLLYGVLSYAIGVTGLCWLIAASLDLVPFTGGPLELATRGQRVALGLGWVVLFGLQHAVMARPAFKARWTRVVHPAIERSSFVLVTGLIVSAMMLTWQPDPAPPVWAVTQPALSIGMRVVAALGWAYLFAASFAIDHFELFGLKQVWLHFRRRQPEPTVVVSRFMYRFDRHPLMTGMLLGLWCTPVMRFDHLLLATGLSCYIVVGVLIEERTLVAVHGEGYRAYRRRVAALVPFPGRRS